MEIADKEDIYRPPEFLVFSHEEEKILKYWEDKEVFKKCQKLSLKKPRYTFFDGPPFATGLPHYGHLLAGTIKDIITRHFYQRGYRVERRFGWDCHGLPVEYEIDKELNIRNPEDVMKMGIDVYNNKCREIVMRYLNEWKEIVGRLGRWIDFDNDYKTLYPWYMETVWWVFKQLYEKGLVYQGVKVMPFSTACSTPLSNFESGQNYKEVVDPCIIVELKIIDSFEDTYFLIWTTTPWTLVSNLAICVNPDLNYVRVKSLQKNKYYIFAKTRLKILFKNEIQYKVLESFQGMYLKGLKYKPPFNYFEEEIDKSKAFRVLIDQYVTDDSGTGIVHQAPYFGDDDYRVCLAAGVITKSSEIICPVDECGRFTDKIPDFCGKYVKDCDKAIIEKLKNDDCIFQASTIKHSYPFCWRSDTPLIYKAVPSWFICVEKITSQLIDCNEQTYWVPSYIKTKRFSNWLKDARDWAVSRNRYWGTPVPIWMSSDGNEIVCIGSISELEKLSGTKVTDLHREFVDKIELPSAIEGRPPLKRVSEVFDCWFESGSMPYAQHHFPFEHQKQFDKLFPADFIAEGIDQTRGWFYTLLVISTALFNKPPFKNLIANGLILAADGQKMSKRKKNYPNPMDVIKKYGADALRLYLINSPAVRAEVLKFQEDNIRNIIRNVLSPLNSSYRFLIQNIYRLREAVGSEYMFEYDKYMNEVNKLTIMDSWILSYKESLLKFVTDEMNEYRLYTVVPNIIKFIEQLTNWYIRLNRKRIKGEYGYNECMQSLDTLYYVLFTITIIISPFIPFLSEYIYQRLCFFNKNAKILSVHSEMLPTVTKSLIKIDIERIILRMQNIIEIGRLLRDKIGLPKKYPVYEVIVIQKDIEKLKDVYVYIKDELNTKKLTMTSNRHQYRIKIRLEPDYKILGQKLKKNLKAVVNDMKLLPEFEMHKFLNEETIEIRGHTLKLSEFKIIYSVPEDLAKKYIARGNNDVLVLVDTTPSTEFEQEGIAKEIISKIQKLKKRANLIPTDKVCVYFTVTENTNKILNICKKYQKLIEKMIKSPFKKNPIKTHVKSDIKDSFMIKDAHMEIKICNLQPTIVPAVNWTNLILDKTLPLRYSKGGRFASVLLQKPNRHYLTMEELKLEIINIFGLYGIPFHVNCGGQELKDVLSANEQTLIVCKKIDKCAEKFTTKMPYSKFYNYEYDDNQIYTAFFENPKCVQFGNELSL